MGMKKASNAILALCRSYYGKRLTTDDFDRLLSCKTLSEFSSVLKEYEFYSPFLESAASDSLRLEEIVHKSVIERYMSICRYERAIGNSFYDYFLTRIEINEILRATMLIIGGHPEEYIVTASPFVARKVSIDLYAMAAARSLEELGRALKGSEYDKTFSRCLLSQNRTYLLFESEFEKFFDDYLSRLCKKCYRGSEYDEVLRLIKLEHDLEMISRRIRSLRFNPSFASGYVSAGASPTFTMLSPRQLRSIKESKSSGELSAALRSTPYRFLARAEANEVEKLCSLEIFLRANKQIRFSPNPGTVTYCYLYLAENERKNLVSIIEGIKYGISPEEIRSTLIVR